MISKDFIRSILLNENQEIRDSILPLFESSKLSLVRNMTVLMLMVESMKANSLSEQIQSITKSFANVAAIVEEYDIKLPEEESLLEKCVKEIQEDGEAPTNSVAGIDASTPRIDPKKKDEDDDRIITP